jgi:YfiR/HmsC-like
MSRSPWKGVAGRGIAAAVLFLLAAPAAGVQDTASEYDVKAAFLYNFTKFVDWPPWAFHNDRSTVRLCVLGDDPFGESLREIAEGEVAGRRLTVLSVPAMNDPAGCQILFVSRSERERLPEILAAVRDAPVMTVSDTKGFLEQGGIINFVLEGSRVRFEINQEAADRARLKISSRLLRLATRVLTSPRREP